MGLQVSSLRHPSLAEKLAKTKDHSIVSEDVLQSIATGQPTIDKKSRNVTDQVVTREEILTSLDSEPVIFNKEVKNTSESNLDNLLADYQASLAEEKKVKEENYFTEQFKILYNLEILITNIKEDYIVKLNPEISLKVTEIHQWFERNVHRLHLLTNDEKTALLKKIMLLIPLIANDKLRKIKKYYSENLHEALKANFSDYAKLAGLQHFDIVKAVAQSKIETYEVELLEKIKILFDLFDRKEDSNRNVNVETELREIILFKTYFKKDNVNEPQINIRKEETQSLNIDKSDLSHQNSVESKSITKICDELLTLSADDQQDILATLKKSQADSIKKVLVFNELLKTPFESNNVALKSSNLDYFLTQKNNSFSLKSALIFVDFFIDLAKNYMGLNLNKQISESEKLNSKIQKQLEECFDNELDIPTNIELYKFLSQKFNFDIYHGFKSGILKNNKEWRATWKVIRDNLREKLFREVNKCSDLTKKLEMLQLARDSNLFNEPRSPHFWQAPNPTHAVRAIDQKIEQLLKAWEREANKPSKTSR